MKKQLFLVVASVFYFILVELSYATTLSDIQNEKRETEKAEYTCTLTISGYGTVEGIGRIPVTLSATEATCEEAAARLRPQIIAMELCNHSEVH